MSEPIFKEFKDGTFSFWAAGDSRRTVIYRVRDDSTPQKRYEEKDLDRHFDRGVTIRWRPATEAEVDLWLEIHPAYPPIYKEGMTEEEYWEDYANHQYDGVDFGDGDEE